MTCKSYSFDNVKIIIFMVWYSVLVMLYS